MSNRDNPKKHSEFGGGPGLVTDHEARIKAPSAETQLREIYLKNKTFDHSAPIQTPEQVDLGED